MKPVPRWKNGPIYKGISKTVRKSVCSGRPCILAERIKSESKKTGKQRSKRGAVFSLYSIQKTGPENGTRKNKKKGEYL
ncbi:hypothetical protein DWY22_03740 [Heyndrickxia coagulans]|nr:hypothetical protein DWY22_03740 [Heyndrickxia coagulans]RGR96452.1 hypothetical protein DWY16_11950 [Heyndrickxia coagulans]